MSDVAVSLSNLTLAYGKTVAVPSLNLDIKKGELVALLGPSGCGKTTTMRAIAGLMSPAAGSISIDGVDVTSIPANKRQIGLVFQSYALFPHLSSFENVAFGLRLKKYTEIEISKKVTSSLDLVGMSHLADRVPSELSGGQQQRISLARSLVMHPKVLLLDEPLSNLDARLRLEMRTELQRLQRQTGITMIFVTHDQSEALAMADRIVLMKDGLVEQIGTPESLYNEPDSVFAADFLGFENIFSVKRNIISNEYGSFTLDYEVDAKHLAWRPSGVVLGQGPFSGIVSASAFAGDRREYVIDTSLGVINADVPATSPFVKSGEPVSFDLPRATARLIQKTATNTPH